MAGGSKAINPPEFLTRKSETLPDSEGMHSIERKPFSKTTRSMSSPRVGAEPPMRRIPAKIARR
jgi:hypothetical protein